MKTMKIRNQIHNPEARHFFMERIQKQDTNEQGNLTTERTEESTLARVSRRSQMQNRTSGETVTRRGETAFRIFAVLSIPNVGIIS